jgi:hypothetical protein
MTWLLHNLYALVCGAFCEGLCALWVLSIKTGYPRKSAALSVFYSLAQVLGLIQAMQYGVYGWVLGYGIGSYIVVRWRT